MKPGAWAWLLVGLWAGQNLIAADSAADYPRAESLAGRTEGKVFREVVTPHWFPDNHHFWYRVATGPDTHEFVLVDATTGKIQRAATAEALGLPENKHLSTSAQSFLAPKRTGHTGDETILRLSNQTVEAVDVFWVNESGEQRPYGQLRAGERKDFNTYAGHVWLVKDRHNRPLGYFEATPDMLEVDVDEPPPKSEPPLMRHRRKAADQSPDGNFSVRFEDQNAVLFSTNGIKTILTKNGTMEHPFRGPVVWSPDSRHCVLFSVQSAPAHVVSIVESSPPDQVQPKLLQFDYYKPGDVLPHVQPVLVDVVDKTAAVIPDDLFTNAFTPDGELNIRWSPRSDEFYFDYNQRGHQLYRVLAVNATNGAVRTVVEERSKTFVDYETKTWRAWLDDSGELLWMSERDGWAHLWLYAIATGTVKNEITRGDWVVREVLKVDGEKRQVWFLASGVQPGEDPYHHQLCRVNFDGSGFIQLTQGDGDYTVEFSPDGNYFIAKYSRVDLPPVTELRRSDDGKLICELEHADATQLVQSGWTPPERFVAKGRDGQTDIYGVLIKPSNFDPRKKYPVVEEVYAGPQDSFAPVKFSRLLRQHQIAELGFIVVQADGMGTDNRGKKFHDVCWKNLQDAGFPDRIAWMKAAAQTRPWMDLSRVGIYGGSAGGQDALRALLDYNDFYQVAVADCGCHDNRMDKLWWNEQWLGWPVDEAYVRSSNVADAHKLKGKLLLMVGELDHNVDPASTMQVVNALEKADKDFEMLVITGSDHGSAETPYGSRRRMDFLVRNLLGTDPSVH
ncbi:MAG TPA: prolyl oligopeptidase family serine peptidase [Verrucomicrobiae bacterium]|jgi:dipeptidyl aminopeptidase/acylaminoacyl peptidase